MAQDPFLEIERRLGQIEAAVNMLKETTRLGLARLAEQDTAMRETVQVIGDWRIQHEREHQEMLVAAARSAGEEMGRRAVEAAVGHRVWQWVTVTVTLGIGLGSILAQILVKVVFR